MKPSIPPGGEIAVIGAGIVGVCCAVELLDAGYRVCLIDQAKPGTFGPSKANAGHIAGASILPLASPTTFRATPGLLLDRQSPLYIPLSYRLKVIPWLMRFAWSCRERTFMNGVHALASLNSMLWNCTDDLYARAGITGLLKKPGAIFLYESERSYRQAQTAWALSKTFGIETSPLPVEQLMKLEPHLKPHYAGAIHTANWGVVVDPQKIVHGIAKHAIETGARLIRARVNSIARTTEGVELMLDSGERLERDGAVITAGAWSKHLTRQLGENIPLEVERGYNITTSSPDTSINHALIFADQGVVATQLSDALRVGGLDELGGLDIPADPALEQRVLETARDLFSDLDTTDATSWMGHRPSMPDSLPVIGRAKKTGRILYAFGHGHYGLTHAPATGTLIADLAVGRSSQIDTAPFSSTRFL